jgi:sodium-dependent dicarboxylate transporter 2/3/5
MVVTAVVGLALYNLAPPDFQSGEYQTTVSVVSSGIDVELPVTVLLAEGGQLEQHVYNLTGTTTNITVTVMTRVPLAPDTALTFIISAIGEPLVADQIEVRLQNEAGFDQTIRPTRQSGQTFTVTYQPLVKSRAALMILAVVAILWFSEGISLVATSMLIPILLVTTEIRTPQTALAPFFDPAVVLILGGFLLGCALSKYDLDKRLALLILSRSTGSGSSLLLTVMAVTAFLSMWISNTASAAIMIPIAIAVISRIRNEDTRNKYGKALVLGVAYAATLGGVASLVGSSPNPLAATYINSFLGIEFSFMSWLPFGVPVVLIMLPIVWQWLLIRFKLPKNIEEIRDLKGISEKEYLKLGPMSLQQKLVVVVFAGVVGLWLTEKLPDFMASVLNWSGHGIPSSIVALMGGLSLLVLRLLDEKDISSEISWSSLLILGSGIALGGAMIDTGLSAYLAHQMSGLGMLPAFLIVVILGLVAVLVTMVASNTGAAVILIPVAIPLAIGLGIDPLLVTMVIAIAVSMDFALPTGTPPSTIAYSTGIVTMKEMVTTGLLLDLVAVLIVTIVVAWIWGLLGLVVL